LERLRHRGTLRLTSDNLNLSAGRHLSEGVADPAHVKLGGAERQMPLAAYFRNVGAALLALLFVANCGMLRVNDDTFTMISGLIVIAVVCVGGLLALG
jgi:hypothetical protein